MRRGLMGLTLMVSLVASQMTAFAWGDTGHMLVGHIAYSKLNPQAREKVDRLVSLIRLNGLTRDKPPKKVLFIYNPSSIAVWMDDLRSVTGKFDKWHFTNIPFFDGIEEKPIKPEPVDALTQIQWCIDALSDGKGTELGDAKALGYLFHLVGDLHQPLHTTSRYSELTNGESDLGGNSFPIKGSRPKLHSYWDAAGGLFSFKDVPRPLRAGVKKLNEPGMVILRDYAVAIMKAYPKSKVPEWTTTDPADWAKEGHDIVVGEDGAYVGIEPGATPDDTYSNKVQDIARRRIALGGYRLAALLNRIFSQQ